MRVLTSIALTALLTACASAPQTAPRPTPPQATTAPVPTQRDAPQRQSGGWDTAALADVIAYAKNHKTTGLLIIQNGKTIAEENWPLPAGSDTFRDSFTYGANAKGALLEDVASQQKSFVALLVAIAIDKGLIDASRSVTAYLGEGWSKAPPERERAITVLSVMQMNTGLTEQFTFAARQETQFYYNTPVYAVLKAVLEKASGKSLDALTQEWLAGPLGMTDTAWRKRPAAFANSQNPTGLVTTPRDVAKMGQLILDKGKAPDGTRIVSEQQLFLLFDPSATNPAYGRLWWLNSGGYSFAPGGQPGPGDTIKRTAGPLIPAAPKDLLAAQGAQERKLYVSPSQKLIVVRMGQQSGDPDFNQQLWLRLAKAAPPAKDAP